MKRITKKWNREGKRPVVLLDFDDVLFDFLGTVNKKYNSITNQDVKLDDYKSWDLSEVGDVHVYMNIIKDPNLWREMPEKDGAMEVVQRLINDGRWNVLICTACTTLEEYIVKVGLIEEKIPGFDTSKILNVVDKHLIRGDIIVDDKVDNLDKCSRYDMKCVLMDMPHNKKCETYQRIYSLKELPDMLEELFCYWCYWKKKEGIKMLLSELERIKKERMTKVTKENMETYIRLRKRYTKLRDNDEVKEQNAEMALIFDICESFIVDVINNDKEYYGKLSSYHFSNEDLMYCL